MEDINPNPAAEVAEALAQIGANIQRGRKEAFRESREAFAKRIGCSPPTLDRIERGEGGVAAVHLISALQAMHALADVVKASSPGLLIATQVPVDFPPEFSSLETKK
jgi:transcriptional regulator with XRE-family HTH domain